MYSFVHSFIHPRSCKKRVERKAEAHTNVRQLNYELNKNKGGGEESFKNEELNININQLGSSSSSSLSSFTINAPSSQGDISWE
jgi:hypothetical protein